MKTLSNEIYYKTAAELSGLLAKKELSSVDLTKAIIERTKDTESKLDAFLCFDEKDALRQAEASDKRRAHGKALSDLDGIPVSIKDIICEEGKQLTCGSRILEKYISPYDATVIVKLKAAGAVLWGRLNLDEFAMGSSTENSAYKPTSNPWNIAYVPGGSSGGSATSVAAGQTIISLGTDTGGSIRQPAAHCGIVGLKPTYGLVSRYGLAAFASSLDQIGPFARSVEDIAIMLQTIAGYDPHHDSTSFKSEIPDYRKAISSKKGPWKIGIPKEYFAEGLSEEVRKAIQGAIDFYKSQGHTITDISLSGTDLAIATYYVIAPAEASSNLARYDGIRYTHRSPHAADLNDTYRKSRAEGFGAEVKRRIMLGTYVLSSGFYDAYYLKAQKARTLLRQDFLNAFEKVDVILTPTTANTAFKKGEKSSDPLAMYLEDCYTVSVNLAGLPGISLPCGFSTANMPIGLQLIGKPFHEATLLNIAHEFESAHNFKSKHPTL